MCNVRTPPASARRFQAVLLALGLIIVGGTGELRAQSVASDDHVGATLVTADGDSLRGIIEWQPGDSTPETIHFQKGMGRTGVQYHPKELQAVFTEDGRRIVSRTANVDQVPAKPTLAADYLRSNQPRKQSGRRFLEVIVAGSLPLYTVRGKRDRYFIVEDGVADELVRRRYVDDNKVWTAPHYQKQLRRRMADCPTVPDDPEDIEYQLDDLKDLVVQYNQCVGDTEVFVEPKQSSVAASFGVFGGGMRSRYGLAGYPYRETAPFGWGNGWGLGVGVTIRFLRTGRHWALRSELVAIHHRMEGRVEAPPLQERRGVTVHFVERTLGKLYVLPRYYIRTTGWSPFVEAGGTVGYLTSIESNLLYLGGRGLDSYVRRQSPITLGAAGGVGVQRGGLQVGFRVDWENGWGEYTNIRSEVINVQLLVGYQF